MVAPCDDRDMLEKRPYTTPNAPNLGDLFPMPRTSIAARAQTKETVLLAPADEDDDDEDVRMVRLWQVLGAFPSR